jgi:hypothetical protein
MNLRFFKRDIPKRAAVIAVVLIAVAGVVTGREKPALEVVESKAPRIEQAAAFDFDLDRLDRTQASAPQNDPFAPRSFAPPPVAAQAAPAAAPSAPPLPFKYVGKLTANGSTEIFVLRGDDLISIAPGQKIDAEYRVDAVSETRIAFTYLPLKTRQSIDLAEADG